MTPLDKCVRCGAPTYSGVQHVCDDTTGWRSNAGKPRYDLLPPDAIEELVRVYTKGAEKYAPRNWERGMPWCSTCFAALLRHAFAWLRGETHDPETGCHHMAHVAWNALALVAYSKRGVGADDRPGVTDG